MKMPTDVKAFLVSRGYVITTHENEDGFQYELATCDDLTITLYTHVKVKKTNLKDIFGV